MNAKPFLLESNYDNVPVLGDAGGRVPHIKVCAFTETAVTGAVINSALKDRRLDRADTTLDTGGMIAAIAYCKKSPSPDLIILECTDHPPFLLAQLVELASLCDSGTKVIVIGVANDVSLFRNLLEIGVTDYMVAPIREDKLSTTILRLFQHTEATKPGKIYAVLGARGGVGSSTVAQNMAAALANAGSAAVMLADLDLQFGSVALNLNFETGTNLVQQLGDVARLDDALLDRLLVARNKHLMVLAGTSATLNLGEPSLDLLDKLIDLAQASFPYLVLDLPHVWSHWVQKSVLAADQVIITATPDLSSLKNAKALLDHMGNLRPNDAAPHLVLNQIAMPKRAEIKPAAFAKALGVTSMTEIAFDPSSFSKASIAGQLLVEHNPKAAASRKFGDLVRTIAPSARLTRQPIGLARLWSR